MSDKTEEKEDGWAFLLAYCMTVVSMWMTLYYIWLGVAALVNDPPALSLVVHGIVWGSVVVVGLYLLLIVRTHIKQDEE